MAVATITLDIIVRNRKNQSNINTVVHKFLILPIVLILLILQYC